jgi:hypothetical protein
MTDFKTCPACGAGLKGHSPETELCWESWRFYCDGVVMKIDGGKLTAEEPCENALRFALARIPVSVGGVGK